MQNMFETNPAEFLIAGLNFGKILNLHEYCLGVLRARLAPVRLKAYCLCENIFGI